MFVFKIDLAPVLIVAIYNIDKRLAQVSQAKEELYLDFPKVPTGNLISICLLIILVSKKLLVAAEIFCEEGVNESYIIVYFSDLKALLLA